MTSIEQAQYGICPCCHGKGMWERELTPLERSYPHNKGKTTVAVKCNNCGGQYMYYSAPTGKVLLRNDGTPCTHEYQGIQLGRCWYRLTCKHCGDNYDVDSSD